MFFSTVCLAVFCLLTTNIRAQLGQGIRTGGGSVVPITGPGGLQQQHHHHNTTDRRASGSLRVSNLYRSNTLAWFCDGKKKNGFVLLFFGLDINYDFVGLACFMGTMWVEKLERFFFFFCRTTIWYVLWYLFVGFIIIQN